MTTISDADVAYLDVLDPHFRPDGPEVTEARARSWYARTPFGITVLRHDVLSRLLSDRRMRQGSHLTLANQGVVDGPVVEWMNSVILSVEGPDHARLRRLVSMAFTPRSVTALRPRMRTITGELIDRFPPGRVEFMSAFAGPYPAWVICELLGVPPELRADVHGWADDLGLAFGYTAGADLLSGLVAARDDGGDRLSVAELRMLVTGLLFAGQDTTHHQLAGNSDPAMFGTDADRFDITVERPPALTFGAGPHYCLGAALARAEMTEALQILPHRLGSIAPDGAARWRPALGITGPTALPIRYTGW